MVSRGYTKTGRLTYYGLKGSGVAKMSFRQLI